MRKDDLCPIWEGVSCDFMLYNMDQKVYVNVYNKDIAGMEDMLGRAEVTCRDLFGKEYGGGGAGGTVSSWTMALRRAS